MPRTLTLAARNAIFAQETGEAFLVLLVIDHADLDEPLRVCNYHRDLVIGADTYIAFPFEISLPEETDEPISRARLIIDNIDRRMTQIIEQITSPATATFSVVLQSSPETVEAGPFDMTIRNVSYDAMTVEGDLSDDDILNEPFPGFIFSPGNTPALFSTPIRTES